jgi:hypothetical protein
MLYSCGLVARGTLLQLEKGSQSWIESSGSFLISESKVCA